MQDFVPLTEEEEGIVARAAEIIQSATAIACTSCQYCVEGCPKQIPIPKYFSLYNQYSLFGEKSNSRGYYQNYAADTGKPGTASAAADARHMPAAPARGTAHEGNSRGV